MTKDCRRLSPLKTLRFSRHSGRGKGGSGVRIGINMGYFAGVIPESLPAQVAAAERAGFESVWCAEAYGSDAFSPLAYLAGHTKTMRLGTAVAQIPARMPAAVAMSANTIDHLSAGRFVLGIGTSGPQVAEGWYGVPFDRPLGRTREYIEVVRRVLDRREPLTHDGRYFPLPAPNGSGLGKALKSSLHPYRERIPILIGAEGPKNVSLAAEIADGWLPMFLAPAQDTYYRERLDIGFAARGDRPSGFEVAATVPVVIDSDVERAADRIRPSIALYAGGMGARGANFHHAVFVRMGHEAAANAIQDAYLSGDRRAAVAAVPTSLIDEIALIGPEARIRDRLALWRESVVDTLLVHGMPDDIPAMARALDLG